MSRSVEHRPYDSGGSRPSRKSAMKPLAVGAVVELHGVPVVHLGRTVNGAWIFVELRRFGDPTSKADWIVVRELYHAMRTGLSLPGSRRCRDRRGQWSRQA